MYITADYANAVCELRKTIYSCVFLIIDIRKNKVHYSKIKKTNTIYLHVTITLFYYRMHRAPLHAYAWTRWCHINADILEKDGSTDLQLIAVHNVIFAFDFYSRLLQSEVIGDLTEWAY